MSKQRILYMYSDQKVFTEIKDNVKYQLSTHFMIQQMQNCIGHNAFLPDLFILLIFLF